MGLFMLISLTHSLCIAVPSLTVFLLTFRRRRHPRSRMYAELFPDLVERWLEEKKVHGALVSSQFLVSLLCLRQAGSGLPYRHLLAQHALSADVAIS
jgi:hypothetical protein